MSSYSQPAEYNNNINKDTCTKRPKDQGPTFTATCKFVHELMEAQTQPNEARFLIPL